jgi:hypothetical protein
VSLYLISQPKNYNREKLFNEICEVSFTPCTFVYVLFSDTYVKLTLIAPNGKEVAHSKTSVRRGQPNPLFKETFMFQVALFQLADVTLMVSVYNKKSMKKKEMIGWFALGNILMYKHISIS